MCPDRPLRARRLAKSAATGGFAIISGIFLLVLIAALTALMMNLSTTQSTTSAQDVQGARAYQAARAGVEWAAYRLLIQGTCGYTQNAPSFPGLTDFTVSVNCADDAATDATPATQIRIITSTATLNSGTVGSTNYVERQLRVSIEN